MKTVRIFLVIISLGLSSCGAWPGVGNPAALTPMPHPAAYWSIEKLASDYPIEIIQVAGTYVEIGQAFGQWYRERGGEPRSLAADEQATARALLAFYDRVQPGIRAQMRGVYAAYNLDLDDMSMGIPIWDDEGIRILLPGVVERHSCSVVFARPEMTADGHARLGRNHDWPTPLLDTLLVFTYPEDGYPTVVMTRGTPGFSASDGMNSRGLALGLASVSNIGYQMPAGPALPSNAAYRLVLEHSASVDEAIAMLRSIPITFVNASPDEVITHILVADRSGASAVLEFLPEGIVVSRADTPYQVMTNSHWAGHADQPDCSRYRTAVARLEGARSQIDTQGMLDVMSAIRGVTQWTVIYDLENLDLVLTFPEVEPSVYHKFLLADFIARMNEP